MNVIIVVDVFRAFTTAAYVLERNPEVYLLATKSEVISRLAAKLITPLLIGKPEKGMEEIHYHIPNSPTRVKEMEITQRDVVHRTEAGARGVLSSKGADIVLAASFVNADATARYVRGLVNPKVTLMPMGHEAKTPSIEDDLCAQYIEQAIAGKKMDLTPFLPALRDGPGKYLFSQDQWQYPSKDFKRCLNVGRFDFAIQADVKDDYAILTKLEVIPEETSQAQSPIDLPVNPGSLAPSSVKHEESSS